VGTQGAKLAADLGRQAALFGGSRGFGVEQVPQFAIAEAGGGECPEEPGDPTQSACR
jgi:hypothetical protein